MNPGSGGVDGAPTIPVDVWAPHADLVELVVGGDRRPMAPDDGDWWRAALPPGTDYTYSLDGGDPLPDPRSRWQPDGVHGPSRVVDPSVWAWTPWRGAHLPSAVMYELHVGTFSPEGTFAGAARRLDHLVDLGVDVVEVMPVNAFPGVAGWGYDGVDLWAVHDPYGGPDGFAAFVDACHRRGIGVVLDVVYNHLGPDGNHLARFGPYFTDRHHTPWGSAVNLDGPGSDEVRRFVIDSVLTWLRDHHLDGLRLDAVHALVDETAIHLLEELAAEVATLSQELGRPLWLVAESDLNDPRLVRATQVGGYGLDAIWNDDFHHALHWALTGEEDGYYGPYAGLDRLARSLERAFVFDGIYNPNRDRRHGRPVGELTGERFVVSLQNHDQVGNRAQGDRIGHTITPGLARVGAALLLTAPYVPLLFQGEEWGASTPFPFFCDHQDPGLADAVREGRRSEFSAFGWDPADIPDPQDPATFAAATLRWEELDEPVHRELLDWYRLLIDLRRRTPALADGRRDRLRARADDTTRTIVVDRGPVRIVANLSTVERVVPTAGRGRLLAGSDSEVAVREGDVALPAESVAILAW